VWSLLICVVKNSSERCAAFGVGANSEAGSTAGAGERVMSMRGLTSSADFINGLLCSMGFVDQIAPDLEYWRRGAMKVSALFGVEQRLLSKAARRVAKKMGLYAQTLENSVRQFAITFLGLIGSNPQFEGSLSSPSSSARFGSIASRSIGILLPQNV